MHLLNLKNPRLEGACQAIFKRLLALLKECRMKSIKISPKAVKLILINLVFLLVLLSLVEYSLSFLLKNHQKLSHPALINIAAKLYRDERNIVQYIPGYAHYDHELSYLLTPGEFVFSNREFSDKFYVNSMGLRDDEASLQAPEIIVVGDSLAMGWGVEQAETFAQIIEKRTGKTVLNAAISSFGTVREMLLLRRLDCSKLRYLIIQYCDNDYKENKSYKENNNHLNIMSAEEYQRHVKEYQEEQRYYPGKYLDNTLSAVRRMIKKRERLKENEAELYLNALVNAPVDLGKVQLITLEIGLYGQNDNDFITKLKKAIASQNYPTFVENMKILDCTGVLRPEHYYILDGHIDARGHSNIAEALMEMISKQ